MNSLRDSIQMLPMKEEIVNAFRNASSPGSMAGLIKELGDVLLISTARSTQKLYFPLCTWVYMWRNKGEHIKSWSVSGGPMQALYRVLVVRDKLQYRIRSGDGSDNINQVIFHAIHGTHLDDISILSQITSAGAWKKRGEMSKTFAKRANAPKVTFTPITMIYFSKMAQALQTKCLGNVEPSSTSRPAFSGKRERVFSQEFLTYLKTGKSMTTFNSDPVSLQFALRNLK